MSKDTQASQRKQLKKYTKAQLIQLIMEIHLEFEGDY